MEKEKKGNSATRAKNKYNAKSYDRIYPCVKKGYKALYEEAAKQAGFSSLSEFLEKILYQKSIEILGEEKSKEIIMKNN